MEGGVILDDYESTLGTHLKKLNGYESTHANHFKKKPMTMNRLLRLIYKKLNVYESTFAIHLKNSTTMNRLDD